MKKIKYLSLASILLLFCNCVFAQVKIDTVAENMLIYQRTVGGWPKAVGDVKVDYHKHLSEPARMATIEDASRNDATLDNNATYKEINYLVKAFKATSNKAYLLSAERGIRYLLKAQYPNGGWPQYYPDSSLYRSQITYNDDAMINTLNTLYDVAYKINGFDVVSPELRAPASQAVEKGIDCILKTQIRVNGKLTVWAQQYNHKTLQPEMARKFELVGLSGEESVDIIRFLMRLNNPSPAIKAAIANGVEWFKAVKITGFKVEDIKDSAQPTGRDRILIEDPSSVIWARYYEIGTNKPFFSGRNSVKVYDMKLIENERRAGYAWYGSWPQALLTKEYPEWALKHARNN